MRPRLAPSMLIIGAGILLFRTFRLAFFEGGLAKLAFLPLSLTFAEMLIDATCIVASVLWLVWLSKKARLAALYAGGAATVLHFIRVIIFALGRTAPFMDFDLRPEFRGTAGVSGFWVGFALILAVLGMMVLIVIYLRGRKRRKRVP